MRTPPLPAREQGFTLIEMIVALALFALISLAGIALLNTVLNVKRRTDRRLEALADLQRAIYLVTSDLKQMDGGPTLEGGTLAFSRHAGGISTPARYSIGPDGLRREIGGMQRAILPTADGLTWQFHMPDGSWRGSLPATDDPIRPDAVRMLLHVRPGLGLSGELRRTVALPAR